MDGRGRHKPLAGDRVPNDATGTHTVQDGDRNIEAEARSRLSSMLASELFARLLLELPGHRRELQSAARDGNTERLDRATHKLLGAVLYCDLPELADALRETKRRCASRDREQVKTAAELPLRLIDELLTRSGYRGDA
jgi:HPt (histidine-containing phosphotransfer) domain-containing protein